MYFLIVFIAPFNIHKRLLSPTCFFPHGGLQRIKFITNFMNTILPEEMPRYTSNHSIDLVVEQVEVNL